MNPPTEERDDGAGSLEVVVLFPLLLLLVVGLLSGALGYHARNLALAAAGVGLRAATAEGAGAVEGGDAAARFLAEFGGETLGAAHVSVVARGDEVAVTVRGTSPGLVPGVPGIPIEQTAAGPRERFTSG